MNFFKLSSEEVFPIYSESLKNIKASLMWLRDDDLDFMIFYETKKGDTGAVYSEDIPGGNYGDLDKFPFISCGESGLDDSTEEVVSYEKMYLNDISSLKKIYFVATNYAELILKRQINFKDYQANLKISPSYSTDQKDRVLISLSSEEKGEFLLMGEIEIGESIYMLRNLNKVMTFEELQEIIPGSENLIL